jgi:regulator of RNase E activity RraA
MKRISQELIDAYQTINTSTIGHVTSEGYVAGLRPIARCQKVYTGNLVTVILTNENTQAIRQALLNCQSGDVLCIDARILNHRACWGALRTCIAMYHGVSAVMVLGRVTDSRAIEQLGFPVFGLGISPLTTSATLDNANNNEDNSALLYQPIHYSHEGYDITLNNTSCVTQK